MLSSSLCIGIIVILLKTKPQEAILPQNQHIKSWQKIKIISDLSILICFGMFVETQVFFRPHLNAHVVNRFCAKTRMAIPKLLSCENLYKYVPLQILNFIQIN